MITIYTSAFCGYCARAIGLLDAKGVAYTEIDAGSDQEKKREMIDKSGRTTFPQIFVGDRHIGGCDELLALDRSGELDPLLASAA